MDGVAKGVLSCIPTSLLVPLTKNANGRSRSVCGISGDAHLARQNLPYAKPSVEC